MAASRQAVVIDLGEYRRRKQDQALAQSSPMMPVMSPFMWCWVWMTLPYGYLASAPR